MVLPEDGAVLNINHQLKCCHFMWQHFILYFYFVIFINYLSPGVLRPTHKPQDVFLSNAHPANVFVL